MSREELVEAESRRKDRDLDLKEREIASKEKEVNASRWKDPTFLALIGASVALIGNLLVARANNKNKEDVERLHLQSTLIVESIKTNGNTQLACKNLTFFKNLKLIDDTANTIESVCTAQTPGPPSLPTSGTFPQSPRFIPITVRDEHGQVIDSVWVQGDHAGGNMGCRTNSNGFCSLTAPPTPFVKITATKAGYKPYELTGEAAGTIKDNFEILLKKN